jgi:hypothetical protein
MHAWIWDNANVRINAQMFRCADEIKCAIDQALRSLLVECEHPEQARTTPNTPEHAKKLIDSAASWSLPQAGRLR